MLTPFSRAVLAAIAASSLTASDARAALDISKFVSACAGDPVVAEDPAFTHSEVTPTTYCQCVAGKLEEKGVSQADINMLVKLHNEDVTDEDVEGYPTLDDLMNVNEGFEDACRASLGLTSGEDEESGLGMPEDEVPGGVDDAMPPEE